MPDDQKPTPPDLAGGVALDRIPEGGLLAGVVGKDPVILTRVAGVVRAFSGKCTHLGAPLAKGLVVDGTVRCPWHHACFDLKTGAATAAPAFDALQAWVVDQDGTTVRVTGKAEATAISVPPAQDEPGMVIVGGGAAGFAAAVALRRAGFAGSVTMVSDEPALPYDRTKLSKDYLEGKAGDEKLAIAKTSLADLAVTTLTGTAVASLDRPGRQVVLADGRRLPYRKLLLATGAEPNRLDVPGATLPHVRVLRSLADAKGLIAMLADAPRVVVVGSSFIGLEAAAALKARGLDVTVVSPEDAPLRKKMGPELSAAVLAVHRAKGVQFRLEATVARIEATEVVLNDGTALPADLVVVGIGVTPRTGLAEAAGLAVDKGITVDAQLRTTDPDIYAAGDIARWPDPHSGAQLRVEHWVVAERQGETAGANMAGGAVAFSDVPFFWSKHFDFSFRYVGHAEEWDAITVEGDLSAKKAVVHFTRNGTDLAVATVGEDMRALESERTMEQAGSAPV